MVLNAWATWCPPCVSELPDLDRFYKKYHDQGVVVLAVNVGDDPATAAHFVEKRGFSFPVLVDTRESLPHFSLTARECFGTCMLALCTCVIWRNGSKTYSEEIQQESTDILARITRIEHEHEEHEEHESSDALSKCFAPYTWLLL